MTQNQKIIIIHLHKHEKITLDEAVELIGANIYANKSSHVGATLSRMVKSNYIKRIKPGIFELV